MNADILAYCQKEGWCKLAFYLLSFFYYLYGYVFHLYFSALYFSFVSTERRIFETWTSLRRLLFEVQKMCGYEDMLILG